MILAATSRADSAFCIPRESGDDPQPDGSWGDGPTYSPRERGWSRVGETLLGKAHIFPARAGMIRRPRRFWSRPERIPRKSGGDLCCPGRSGRMERGEN